jgi:predicted nucleic acid-binding Zn ribbon protein
MQHIAGAIKNFLKKTGLEKAIAQQNALEVWSTVVGKNVAKNASAESIEHGILLVRVTTPAWRQELQFQKKEIINSINKELRQKIIKDIKFI